MVWACRYYYWSCKKFLVVLLFQTVEEKVNLANRRLRNFSILRRNLSSYCFSIRAIVSSCNLISTESRYTKYEQTHSFSLNSRFINCRESTLVRAIPSRSSCIPLVENSQPFVWWVIGSIFLLDLSAFYESRHHSRLETITTAKCR